MPSAPAKALEAFPAANRKEGSSLSPLFVFWIQLCLEETPDMLVGDLMMIDDLTGLDLGSKSLRRALCRFDFSLQVLLLHVRTKNFFHELGILEVLDGLVDVSRKVFRVSATGFAVDFLADGGFEARAQ